MPTLAHLAAYHGARFTFTCGPCRRIIAFEPAEMIAICGAEMTFDNLKRVARCQGCRMPVDGDFRMLDFSSTEYTERLRREGFPTGSF